MSNDSEEPAVSPERVVVLINDGFALFDRMCHERHVEGQEQYGAYTFLNPDKNLIEETMEEIADAGNYLRYMFAKLHLMNTVLSESLGEKDISIGPRSFQSSKPSMKE